MKQQNCWFAPLIWVNRLGTGEAIWSKNEISTRPTKTSQFHWICWRENLQDTTEQRDFFTIEHTYILTIDGRFRLEFGVSMLIEVVNAHSADHQAISPLFLKSIESMYKTVHRGGVEQGPFWEPDSNWDLNAWACFLPMMFMFFSLSET